MGRRRLAAVAMLAAPLMGVALAGPGTTQAVAQPVAQPSPTPSSPAEAEVEVPPAVPGENICTIVDWRMQELSGLVALDDGGYIVINDGTQSWQGWPIFLLGPECQPVGEIYYTGDGTFDPEDLAYDRAGGVLWVADIGDNAAGGTGEGQPRPTVALWRVELTGDRTPVIHRFAYPDGAHDAEALVLDGDGMPLIITKEVGAAGIYRPVSDPVPNNPHEQAVPLERVGEFSPPDTGAEHAFGRLARLVITGGATAPDGSRVVLRTYTDAFEFDVTDGDVAAAITDGTPRITPLPDEPLGEAITYSPDGETFLTVSESPPDTEFQPVVLRYTPTEPAPEPTPEQEVAAPPPASRSLLDRLGPQGIINLVGVVGVVGLIMVGVGVYGIVRARRAASDDLEEDEEDEEEYERFEEPGIAAARARVAPPDSAQPGWEQPPGPQPGVYTSRTASYHEPGYEHPEPGYDGVPSPDPAPSPAPPRGGTVYSAGAGYQEHPFDQDNPQGYPDGRQDGYRQSGYQDGYQQGGYQEGGGYPPHQQPEVGGVYGGGNYQYRDDEVPDYYSDDPDYPYEFRDRGNDRGGW